VETAFYVHVVSGPIAWKYEDLHKKARNNKTPSRAKSEIAIGPTPNNAVLGAMVDMYSTPCRPFKFGTLSKPIQLDGDEVSDTFKALSDLTNSQLVKKGPRKRLRLLRGWYTKQMRLRMPTVVLRGGHFWAATQ
jgi:hypothetical protein